MNEDQIHKNVIAEELMEFLWGMESDAIVRCRKINEECSITTISSVDNSCFTIIKQYEERTETMFIPASLEELFGPRVEKNPEWKNAQDTCVHTEDKNHYIKDAGKWYRILKRSETIPENAQFLDVNKWHFTANSGQKQTHSESLYRVPSDGPPIPGGEDKDPLLGDFRWMNLKKNSLGGEVSIGGEEYMREGEQWFRLMKAGEKIPQYAQYSFNGNPVWCQTVLSGEAVDLNHGRSYRVQCDPPHGAFRGPLKPT